jgi:hypothetical protein
MDRFRIGQIPQTFGGRMNFLRIFALSFLTLAPLALAGETKPSVPDNPIVKLEQTEVPAVRWRIYESLLTSPEAKLSLNDLIYIFSLLKREMTAAKGPIPEDSPAAVSVTCGWFTGIYNRQSPFIYISPEPGNDLLLTAFIAQYHFLLLNKLEKAEPERVSALLPLAITVSLMSWLDLSPEETVPVYQRISAWAAQLAKANLRPGVSLIIKFGSGPGFPGKPPANEFAAFKSISAPVTKDIIPSFSPAHRAVYGAQEDYAFPEGMAWLEPLGMVAENANEAGLDDKGLSAVKSRIEAIKTLFQQDKK